ncbi:MAG TPA: hypothetical protein VFV72_07865 [Candidatus Limnocylindrales bacterium]|nr:hypothetical protein [Candidatus Limnocylindrales bacterium]
MGLLAAREPELDLRPALAGEIEAERDERQALRLRPAQELVDLRASEEQFPDPLRLVVVAIALLERRDMGTDQPRLVALDARVGVGEVDLAGADGLDLGTGQDEAGLERLLDRELVPRPAIERDGVLGNEGLLPDQAFGSDRIACDAGPCARPLARPPAFG